ncbi:MAG: hypothetical protein KH138_05210 [Firmicutes bacterium]|nr:hypothetical protein [Bacillota bacterium]
MKKRNRITVCLVAGVLILAVSAGAAFGSVSGYSTYKEAVKALALKTDNVTMQGSVKATLDGKEFVSMTGEIAIDGKNKSGHVISSEFGGQKEERYDTILGNTETWFNADSKYYNEYTYDNDQTEEDSNNLLGVPADDEMSKRMVNFMEIAADTVMGDLKNNFVQLGKDGDKTQYQIEISKDQVPSLVNAGLSLFAYSVAADEGTDWGVYYENYSASELNAYEKLSGNKLSEDFRNGYLREDGAADREVWYDQNEKQIQEIADFLSEKDWERQYYDQLDQKQGGIVFVKTDGTSVYYKDYKSYAKANPKMVEDKLSNYIGQDMVLKVAQCKFGVDKNGNLTNNTLTATFTTTDQDGKNHELVVTADVTLSNYGTTTVQKLDTGDRTKMLRPDAENSGDVVCSYNG